MQITLPHNFELREYQKEVFRAIEKGYRRIFLLHHRRAGKDVTTWNLIIRESQRRVGTYLYIFPTASLGRRVIWTGALKDGKRFLDFIPSQLIKRKQEQTMMIELLNGSIINIVGSDRFLNVGIGPVFCAFSEFSLQDYSCWDYIRPILVENNGIALMNTTPRGKNDAYELWEMARQNPDWWTQKLTIDDTGVMTKEDIQHEIDSGMSETMVQQEFYCSFTVGQEGSFYAKLVTLADEERRICNVPIDPHARVMTFWDLGVGDSTAIIFAQRIGKEIHFIDYYENQGEGLEHYARTLQEKNYLYDSHYAPHDIMVRELGSGAKTRLEIAKSLGINFKIVPNVGLFQGIELVRGSFPRFWFDKTKCSYLLKCISNYRKEYNHRLKVFSESPCHDFSSHACDALRYLAVIFSKENTEGQSNFAEYNQIYRRNI